MKPTSSEPVIAVTSAATVRHYVNNFRSQGAPVEQLLENVGIRPDRLGIPGMVVPLQNAYRFAESACHSLQDEHLGLKLGLATTLQDFGRYGRSLQAAATFGKYLETGVALYNTLTTGERLWLSEYDGQIRLNIASPGDAGLGIYQSHLCAIAVTIAVCRKALGPTWSPGEIGLSYQSREKIPSVDLFAESRVISGLPQSYICIPRSVLGLRLHLEADASELGDQAAQPLPMTLIALVEKQIQALIIGGEKFHIEMVAESLMMSKRTLQRAIAKEGMNYFQLLSDIRLRQAARWLDHSDKPVTEIALALGYTEASNFTRAFRRRTGISPRAYRKTKMISSPQC